LIVNHDVLVLAEAAGDSFVDPTFELLGKARELATAWGGRVLALVLGPGPDPRMLDADVVLTVSHPKLDAYTPDAHAKAAAHVVAERDPKLVLLANTTKGMDLCGALSVWCRRHLVAYAVDVRAEGDDIVATSQLFAGRLLAEVVLDGGRGVCAVVGGSFPPARIPDHPPAIEALPPPPWLDDVGTIPLGTPSGEDEDIDITKAPMLVGVGRGLGSQGNVDLAKALAVALGASVSGTSQVCDLGWLPRTRHVGKSGVKVRPRAYLSFGISGAPEHLEGIRESELIIACNTDAAAPIFDAAQYGTTVDALELIRALTDRVQRG
jgi:electron transfer flavoprotein alpha subunit